MAAPLEYAPLIHLATQRGSEDLLRNLLKMGFDVNFFNTEKKTPLQAAVVHGNLDAVLFLLNQGANLHLHDALENSALDYAIENFQITEILLARGAHNVQKKSLKKIPFETPEGKKNRFSPRRKNPLSKRFSFYGDPQKKNHRTYPFANFFWTPTLGLFTAFL